MSDCPRTDNFTNLCADSSGGTRSELNHILEINEAFADNFILVIPKIPTLPYLSSYFKTSMQAKELFGSVSTSGSPESIPDVCDSGNITRGELIRESNLDLKNFMLYVSDVDLPTTSVATVTVGTQFASLERAAKINFSDLSMSCLVSENLLNYNAILYWLYALHNPEEYNKVSGREMIEGFFTEIYFIITNNHRQKVAEYRFLDAFPYSLSSLPMTYKNADNLTMNVSWKFSGMLPSDNFVLRYV